MQGIDLDFMSQQFRRDPYPIYEMLRNIAPVFPFEYWGATFLSRHEHVTRVLKDPRFGHAPRLDDEAIDQQVEPEMRALWKNQSRWIVFLNPPDHTRLRGLAHKAFTPRTVERLRDQVQARADDLLDKVQDNGRQFELMADFAFPLPVMVICELLGVPTADRDLFQRLSGDLAGTLDIDDRRETYIKGNQAAIEFERYFNDLIAERRKTPGDDLLSNLIAVEEGGEKLTHNELLSMLVFLLVAGHETTMNLIGNGMLALLRQRDQFDLLKAHPEYVDTAVEELLRFDSPVQMTSRMLLDDVEIEGHALKKGQFVSVLLGSANHDPAVFDQPDKLNIRRDPNPHHAFGSGIHYCLGAPLARMEGRIAFNTLLRRFPTMELAADDPPRKPQFTIRGLQALPLKY